MITFIRSTAGSWVVKILFVVLIASFAVWGVGDIFRDRGLDQRVGKVGDRIITLAEIDRIFQDQLENLRRTLDPSIEPRTAIALGALDTAASQIVAGALIDEAADGLKLRASDDDIARDIAQNPTLQGIDGQFDPRILRNILASNGLTEKDFLAQTRRDSARQQILGASSGTITAPKTLVDAMFSYANERRSARFVYLLEDDQNDLDDPTSDALETSFEENSERYRAPEYRRLAILTLAPEDMMDEISIDEAQIQTLYEARSDTYNRPEFRDFVQVIVQEEELAKQITEAANSAGSLNSALDAIGDEAPSPVTLDAVTQKSMLTPELGDAAFAMIEGTISAPIQSPFGWHVLEATSIIEAGMTPLADVRADLLNELKSSAATDAVFEVANQLMDERAGGATLDDIARQFSLTVQYPVAVGRDGRPDLGGEAPDLPYAGPLLAEAFALDIDGESLLQEQPDGGYFAVRVEEITEPRDRAFEDVRDQVRDVVKAEMRAAAVAVLADDAVALLGEGRTLDAIAADLGLDVGETSGFLRTDPGSGDLAASAIEPLFGVETGVHVRVESPAGEVIAVLTAIEPADLVGDDPVRDRLADQLASALRVELTDQLSDALSAEYPVELNRERLLQFYTSQELGG